MAEAVALRYLFSKGWVIVENEWFSLKGRYDRPVCLETAYHLQKSLEQAMAA